VKRSLRRQRGIALILVMAVLAMGGTWFLVKRLNQLSANHLAIDRAYNAQVLNRAKQALIGYVVAQANKAGENNPGALPCPEAPGTFNDVLNGTDGKMNSAGCSLPAVGRYPWRTIGTEKFLDSASEPLWYVVSPGWAITGVGANTSINSNSVGQLNIDGVSYTTQAAGDTVIALLIAPGPVTNVTASTGCAAWSQARSPTPDVAPDWRNYLECDNATSPADTNFVTSSTNSAFNDQVLKITVADIMPGIEAAVADRIHREIDPALKTVYGWSSALAGAAWGNTTLAGNINSSSTTLTVASSTGLPAPNFRLLVDTELMLVTAVSGTTLTVTRGYENSGATTHSNLTPVYFGGSGAVYPYAATFANPSTSAMQGTLNNRTGLLPMVYSETAPGSGTACSSGTRCNPTLVSWTNAAISGGSIYTPSCTVSATSVSCTFYFRCSLFSCLATTTPVQIDLTASNVAMAMRTFTKLSDVSLASVTMTNLSSASMATTNPALAADGSTVVSVTGNATLPGGLGAFLGNGLCSISGILGLFLGCKQSTVTINTDAAGGTSALRPISVFHDHPLLYSQDSNFGWFTRNKWEEVTYYAVANGYSPAGLPAQPACTTGSNCLTVTNVTPSGGQRAMLILAGRSINGSTRPSATLSDYLEFGNATGSYESQTVSRANAASLKKPFNDRIVVVDTN